MRQMLERKRAAAGSENTVLDSPAEAADLPSDQIVIMSYTTTLRHKCPHSATNAR